ncbi:MAG: type transport system ATP-binding protein, partial [Thermoleophilaceae bacterium]|nr:type transport system ATP-binding protein [Thermoleophilaceae bacterium]
SVGGLTGTGATAEKGLAEAPAPARAAISARSLSKAFRLPHEKYTTVKDRVVHPFGSRSYGTLQALDDVSFDVRRGEFFGVVGKNGSGKSTLLKCLAGIYRVDAGEVEVTGRVAPFIELGVGFNHEMTARDNAVMNATMLGLSPREAHRRFDSMVEFAELEEFVDLKLKNYSSGMIARLAFSVTVQVDADVLLFDEVLAVGDGSFQQKCLARFEELRAAGRTVVLVTHDMEVVKRLCDRALLLHEGRVADLGEPAAVARSYDELNRTARLGRRYARGDTPSEEAPARRSRRRRRDRIRPPRPAPAAEVRRTLAVARALAVAQFKLRYLDSALSYLWSVMRPLAYFAVLYLFVTRVAGLDHGVAHYPAYLFTAVMLWTYFEQTASAAVQSLVDNEPLLRTVPLPRVSIPISVLIGAFFDLCANLLAVLAVLLLSGVDPRAGWLELPLLVLLLSILAGGAALFLSALYVRFRDVNQIWIVISQALFFGTPIFYVVGKFGAGTAHTVMANPLAAIFTEMRHALIDPGAPSAAAAIGGAPRLLIPLAVTAAVVALGAWVFRRESPWVAENL